MYHILLAGKHAGYLDLLLEKDKGFRKKVTRYFALSIKKGHVLKTSVLKSLSGY